MMDTESKRRATMIRHRKRMELMVTKFLPLPPTALYDIGVGPKTEWERLKLYYPNMDLYGCEPNPQVYNALVPEFEGTYNGKLYPVGIAERAKDGLLHWDPDNLKCSSLFPEKASPQKTPVKLVTLDQFDRWANCPSGIILWMDIEGSELLALKGATSLLRSGRVTAINLEVRDECVRSEWPTFKQICDYLSKFSYECVLEYNDQKTHRDAIFMVNK